MGAGTRPGVTDIVEYEIKLDQVVTNYPDPLICVYDLNQHGVSVVMDILRAHPWSSWAACFRRTRSMFLPKKLLEELRQHSGERQADSAGKTERHPQ
jgi:hypothetical protein